MKDWSTRITLRETLSRAEKWPGEAYFDGDKHKLVLRRKTRKETEKRLTELTESAERTTLSILDIAHEIREPQVTTRRREF